MQTYDIAVVGSGVGGSLIASLHKDKKLIVFEKDTNLGGCSGNFKRYGYTFNTGATTLAGYEKNHPLKKILQKAGIRFDLESSEVAIRFQQGEKVIDRGVCFETFMEQIEKNYPHKNNEIFWKKIKKLDEKFWRLKHLHFAKYRFISYMLTLVGLVELFLVFRFSLFQSARSFIKKYLPDISPEYLAFIDSGLLITVQATSKEIPLLSLALGLSYPFHKVYFAKEGMGSLFEELLKGVDVRLSEEVVSITKESDFFLLQTTKQQYKAKKVILNATLYDSAKLFVQKEIKEYYEQFDFHDQSAFTLYMVLKSKEDFLHHYQILLDKEIPNAISKSFFVSFWKQEEGVYSLTISTHTKASFWLNLDKQSYKQEKLKTEEFIKQAFLENFVEIQEEDIVKLFSASSKTFQRYIGRSNCGGSLISLKNLTKMASCKTPFEGLYNIGDTVFAGQGWPGVALGVSVLDKELYM
jgi:phytoene dehydrogenase-like protein